MDTFTLLHDDAVHICVETSARPYVDVWLPFSATRASAEHATSVISVRLTHLLRTAGIANDGHADNEACHVSVGNVPTLRLGGVEVYVDQARGSVELLSATGIAAGRIDLKTLRASVDVLESVPPSRQNDVSLMLTLCVALLLNRLDRALMHAAAVVPPNGAAWLLVGDTHAGKTTTTMNLMTAGWQYLSDDHVVLARSDNTAPTVEGWPRTFHLDAGWSTDVPKNHRHDVDPRQFSGAQRPKSTALGGVLFPVVEAHQPTRLVRVSAAQALTGIVRQSPWLMADRHAAPSTLALFTEAARLPAYELRLGLDTFNNPLLLADRLSALTPSSLSFQADGV